MATWNAHFQPLLQNAQATLDRLNRSYEYIDESGVDLAFVGLEGCDQIKQMDAMLGDLAAAECRVKNAKAALETLREKLTMGDRIDNIEQEFTRLTNQQGAQDHKTLGATRLREFHASIAGVTGKTAHLDDDDDAIQVLAARESFVCPVSQATFVDPVRSVCGHSFSRSAIEGLMRNRAINCPVAGCSKLIAPTDLKPDRALQRRLLRSEIEPDDQNA